MRTDRRRPRWGAIGVHLAGGLAALVVAACAGEETLAVAGSPSDALVFVRNPRADSDLYWARLDDGEVSPLLPTPDRDEAWPYWSQAAGRLVFQSRPRDGKEDFRLQLLDPATGRVEPLDAAGARKQHWSVWAPDGRRLAYALVAERGGQSGLAVVELASGDLELFPARGRFRFVRPEFAPDSRRIVAQRRARSRSQLWIFELGQEPRPLTGDSRWFEQKGRFTRDGESVVFTRRPNPEGPGDVVLIHADGSGARMVASTPESSDHTARPSPTRDELALISDRDGNPDVFLTDLAGGLPRRITRTPEREEHAPRWSPDGERIALTVTPTGQLEGSRVVVVDREGGVLLDTPGAMPDWMPPWPSPQEGK